MLFVITAFGVLGYMMLEGWSFHDSLFMTIITLSTVGYNQVKPLSPEGELFTSLLIVFGIGVAMYAFTVFGRTAIEGELFRFRRMAKMRSRIERLNGHIIVCGFGRLANYLVPELLERDKQIVVIENNPDVTAQLDAMDILYVEGSAEEDRVLLEAGLKRAETLLALLGSDADNVFVTLSARYLNQKIRIISRAESQGGESKMMRAGANHVVSLFKVSSTRIVQQLMHHNVNDFLEIVSDQDGNSLSLEQLIVPDNSALVGQTLEESKVRQETGVMIAAFIGRDGDMLLSPGKDSVIQSGATVIALGTNPSLEKFSEML